MALFKKFIILVLLFKLINHIYASVLGFGLGFDSREIYIFIIILIFIFYLFYKLFILKFFYEYKSTIKYALITLLFFIITFAYNFQLLFFN